MGRRMIVALTFSFLVAGGCGEYLTFSKDSREQGLRDLEAGRTQEATGAFRDAVRDNPRDAKSFYYLGTLYAQDRQYVNAITNLKTSLEVQRTLTQDKPARAFKLQTIDALAKTIAEADARDAEINSLEQKAAGSVSGEEYLILAEIFRARGDADSAIGAYQKAGEQAPQWFEVAKREGLYLQSLGLKPQAEASLRKAYRLNDEDVEVQTGLRQLGIIPGPALKEEGELARPILPKGPIPPLIKPEPREPLPGAAAPMPRPTASPAD